jgi:phage shock protein PspC (stress-responsive transcriptional regulator)
LGGSFGDGGVAVVDVRSLFGVSFIIMFLLAIIFYVISAFTINDVAKHENSSKMFGGKKSKK